MRDEIIKMAQEAGWRVDPEGEILEGDDWHIQTDIVERFFHMAQAAEREACANLCDELHLSGDDDCGAAADAIRARRKK